MELLFQESLKRILSDYKKQKYVVATSGGVDSMVLASLMVRIIPSEQLIIAHFNHELRGEESENDMNLVLQFAEKNKIPFEFQRRQGAKVSEAALRKERQEFLENIRLKHRADYIVLAHHLQDQIETFLMRLLRGTGLDGLAVMQPKNGLWIRPLLSFSKDTLLLEAQKNGIAFREDKSNLEPKYFRNKIRLQLLPEMVKLSEQYGGKERWLEKLPLLFEELSWAKKELNSHLKTSLADDLTLTPFWIRITRKQFDAFSTFKKMRTLRWVLDYMGLESLGQREMKLALQRIQEGVKRFSTSGVEIISSCDCLYFVGRNSHTIKPTLEFKTDNDLVFCDALEFRVRMNQKLQGVHWRQCLPGDRFQGKKLKEYFLEKRIPLPERSIIPLLAKNNSGEILWVFPERSNLVTVEQLKFPFAIK